MIIFPMVLYTNSKVFVIKQSLKLCLCLFFIMINEKDLVDKISKQILENKEFQEEIKKIIAEKLKDLSKKDS